MPCDGTSTASGACGAPGRGEWRVGSRGLVGGQGRLGVRFPVPLDRRLEAGLAVGDHKTSMLQDLEAGKRLELDCMTGAVAELAGQLGIDVPSVRAVHACAKLLDHLRQRG